MNVIQFRKTLNLPKEEASNVLDGVIAPGEEKITMANQQALTTHLTTVFHLAANLQELAPEATREDLINIALNRIGKARGQKKASGFARTWNSTMKALMNCGFKHLDSLEEITQEYTLEQVVNYAKALQGAWRIIPRLQKAGLLKADRRVEAEKFTREMFATIESPSEGIRKLFGWIMRRMITIEEQNRVLEALREWENDPENKPKPKWPSKAKKQTPSPIEPLVEPPVKRRGVAA